MKASQIAAAMTALMAAGTGAPPVAVRNSSLHRSTWTRRGRWLRKHGHRWGKDQGDYSEVGQAPFRRTKQWQMVALKHGTAEAQRRLGWSPVG